MLIRSDTLLPWRGEKLESGSHPLNIEQLWTDAELLAAGLGRFAPFVLAEGKRIIGNHRWERGEDGDIVELYDVEDIPPPTAQEITAERDAHAARFGADDVLRALGLVLLDESNRHAEAFAAIKAATAGAATLAAFKTAIAAITFPPPRTRQQLLVAFRAKLDNLDG